MALFDFASIGKDMVAAARKKGGRKEDKADDDAKADDEEEQQRRKDDREALEELLQADMDGFVSAADGDTDHEEEEDDDEDDDENDDPEKRRLLDDEDDAKSTASGRSNRSLGKRLIRKMYSSKKMSMLSRKNSAESTRSAKSPPRKTKTTATFEPITMEMSNSLALSAQSAGYGPAFRLLKTMNRQDRETIMEMLLIRRKGVTFNDESDAYDIIFKKIFGIRSRTNTALRAVRVLSQSTWVHTLIKVATALNFSTKMVLSSGDWRIPTRITSGISNRSAKKAVDAEFLSGSSPVLDKAEQKFYSKLQRNIEARLGARAVKVIRALVYEQAGPDLCALVFGEGVPKEEAVEPIDEMDEHQQIEDRKDTVETLDTLDTLETAESEAHAGVEDEAHAGASTEDEAAPLPAISMNMRQAASEQADGLAGDGAGEGAQSQKSSKHKAKSAKPKKQAEKKKSKRRGKSKSASADFDATAVSAAEEDEELLRLRDSFQVPHIIENIESAKPGFGKFALLLLEVIALRAKAQDENFVYADKTDMIKKMALVGAKDGIIGLSLGIPLATFVNPFLGFPLMTMSFINLSMGSTEFNIIEPVCMIQLHQLFLAANGTSIQDL